MRPGKIVQVQWLNEQTGVQDIYKVYIHFLGSKYFLFNLHMWIIVMKLQIFLLQGQYLQKIIFCFDEFKAYSSRNKKYFVVVKEFLAFNLYFYILILDEKVLVLCEK